LQRDGLEVLELDVVASTNESGDPTRVLVDAKKGRLSQADMFKIFGWRTYLGIEHACIVHGEKIDQSRREPLEKLAAEIRVSFQDLSTINPAESKPLHQVNDADKETIRLAILSAWFKQIAVRVAYSQFLSYCRSMKDSDLAKDARAYDRSVQVSFFNKEALERVRILYDAYYQSPKLTRGFVAELALGSQSEAQIWNEVWSTPKRLWLQYIMLLEHRGRIGVVKNALDFISDSDVLEGVKRNEWPSELISMPASFQDGLHELLQLGSWRKVSTLYQLFIELFGGWYVEGSNDFTLLAKLTGVAEDEIAKALALYDTFFPTEGGWFTTVSGIRILKLVPGFVRGTGCFLRRRAENLEHYGDVVSEPYGGWHLSNWHNALFGALEPILGVQQ
jgi:hypothetical protein